MASIGFIGGGNMAGAIIGGIANAHVCDEIFVFDLDAEKVNGLKKLGAVAANSACDVVLRSDFILLAVKPQNIAEVLEEIRADIKQDSVIISIAAGITAEFISKMLSFEAKVVLVMPNTPLMLSCGATAMSRSGLVSDDEFAFVRTVFESAGIVEVIAQDKMNEIIPINGSSPAFIYRFAECFIGYGKSVGLDEKVCLNLFSQALIGSAKMMMESNLSISELITMVSSKGGTTIAGLEGLNENGLAEAVAAACEKCVNRAYELTK